MTASVASTPLPGMPGIEALAYHLPARVVTNADLHRANPSWDFDQLLARTGVESRHIAEPGETALDLARNACARLAAADALRPEALDGLIFCTQTPDYPLPGNAFLLHEALGLRSDAIVFDVSLACSGFVYVLGLARSLVLSGSARRILIVTADTYSRLVHEADRSSRTLFGDGAAVAIVGAEAPGFRIRDVTFGTSGRDHRRFIVPAGGARLPKSPETAQVVRDRSGNARTLEHIEMDGLGVLAFFNSAVPRAVKDLLARNGLALGDVGAFVFHQASRVALTGVVRGLGIDPDRAVIDMADTGNLVSASIPTVMARAQAAGRFRPGDRVVLCGFGVGLSWATALIEV